MFYYPKENDHIMNRLVSYIDGPFCHVELSFEDGVASSIMHGEKVFCHKKNYTNTNYQILSFSLTEQAYQKIRTFCENAARMEVKFCLVSMLCAGLPVQIWFKREKRTFCSRFVTEALQAGNFLHVQGLNPMCVTPSKLHNILNQQNERMLDTVPGRLQKAWAV
jgi:hypothetical protein